MKKCNKNQLPKEEHIGVTGLVVDTLPGTKFKVRIDNTESVITCTISGKLRMNSIQITEGDSVEVEISPYDLTAGRIVWRNK